VCHHPLTGTNARSAVTGEQPVALVVDDRRSAVDCQRQAAAVEVLGTGLKRFLGAQLVPGAAGEQICA
jgi:hypothetical protein